MASYAMWAALFLVAATAAVAAPHTTIRGAAEGAPLLFYPESASGAWTVQGLGFQARIDNGAVHLRQGGRSLVIRYEGARTDAPISGEGQPASTLNRIVGNDPASWRTGIAAFAGARVRDLYPGVDLLLSSRHGSLKSEFVVAPGTDPSVIRVRYEGALRTVIEPGGDLRVETAAGDWIEDAPFVYQAGAPDGQARQVQGSFRIHDDHSVGFTVGDYDARLPLVIDPILSFSSMFSSWGTTVATGLAVDTAGNTYIAGYTDDDGFPLASPPSTRGGGVDIFLMKLAPGGTSVVYATYIGGSWDDRAFAIAVDTSGAAYLTGWTTSPNFPLVNPWRNTLKGGRDAFVLKVPANGNGLAFSTYYGGSGVEAGYALRADSAGVWVAGETDSSDLPVQAAWQASRRGGVDGFLARFSSSGLAVSSSYVGGSGDESFRALATDGSGNVYLAGSSDSVDLGLPTNVFQRLPKGGQDALVLKFNSNAGQLTTGTFLGGLYGSAYSGAEVAQALAVDAGAGIVVGGMTPSSNFPLKLALRSVFSGGLEGFVTRIDPTFAALTWSTFVGGIGRDSVEAIALDGSGRIYAAGRTSSMDLPQIAPIQTGYKGGNDAMLVRIAADGSKFDLSTYLGGTSTEGITGMAVNSAGSLLVAGSTASIDFPQVNALYAVSGNRTKAFIAELREGNSPPEVVSVAPSSGSGDRDVFEFLLRDPQGASDIAHGGILINKTYNISNACYLSYNYSAGLLYLANDTATAWTGGTVGSTGTLSNSQCDVRLAGSSMTASGPDARIRLDIVFKPAIAGTINLWIAAADTKGLSTPYKQVGTYTVTALPEGNSPPEVISVTPSSGSGDRQVFEFLLRDPQGASDISHGGVLINKTYNVSNACYLSYNYAVGLLYLANDNATAWTGGTVGSSGTLSNSQCDVRLAGSSMTASGLDARIRLDIVFKPTIAGTISLWIAAADMKGLSTPYKQVGAYTVTPTGASQPPGTGSLTPSAGSGSRTVFSYSATDPDGGIDVASGALLLNTGLVGTNGCYIAFDRASGTIYLGTDTLSAWPTAIAGSTAVLQNSQCIVRAQSSSSVVMGNTATFSVDVEFKSTWIGTKDIYTQFSDRTGAITNWTKAGSYTVTASGSQTPAAPEPVSVSPASGAGSGTIFTWTYSDANGADTISSSVMLINGPYTAERGCFMVYEHGPKRIYLAADNGTSWSSAVLGQSINLTNSQCTVRLGTSTATASGNQVQVRLDIGFKAAFLGVKSIWTHVTDVTGLTSTPYKLVGSYNVTSAQAVLSVDKWEAEYLRRLPAVFRREPERLSPYPEA